MPWLQTDYIFDKRRLTFFINDADRCIELQNIADVFKDDPESMVDAIREIIVEARPELKGVSIYGISFDYNRLQWDVHCYHPSFAPVSVGSCTDKVPLY